MNFIQLFFTFFTSLALTSTYSHRNSHFLKKNKRSVSSSSCLHYKSECSITADNCCGHELLSCEAFKDEVGKKYFCGSCLNRKCGKDEHCCDSRLNCVKGRCQFPLNADCEPSTEADDSPTNCYNSFLSCSKGLCKACGGVTCSSDNECCTHKFYKCDPKINRCVKFRGCQESGNACVVSEDCCEPKGCKNNLCQGCLRFGSICRANEECCESLFCNGLTCDYLHPDSTACTSSFECQSGYCRDGACGACVKDTNSCESTLECCDSLICTPSPKSSTSGEKLKTICSPKKLCSETDEECKDLECCDGVCKEGICHACLGSGTTCSKEAAECCGSLICTTNPANPETSVCSDGPLCNDLGDGCGENGLECCIGICQKGKCVKLLKELQRCSSTSAPCEPPLICTLAPATIPPQSVCSMGKLCLNYLEPCESSENSETALPCCNGDCLQGKCQQCLPESSPCELGRAACCEGMKCVTNPQNPALRLCSPQQLCLELLEDCPSTLTCCTGKCYLKKCQNCLHIGSPCLLEGSPCCGKAFCTDNPQKPGFHICSLSRLCAIQGETCSPSNPCCNGLCHQGRCHGCLKIFDKCGPTLPSCCQGNNCVTNPASPNTKICSPTSLCTDVGDSCSASSKCCQGHCENGKCVFCLNEGIECTNEQSKCCSTLNCFLLPFGGGRRICATRKLCQEIHDTCDNIKKFCCTGVCHRGFCELCRKEGDNCGELSPACCQEFTCLPDQFDAKFMRCQNSPIGECKKTNEPCIRDEQCCKGLCYKSACVECLIEGATCEGKEKNLCCGIMSCVTNPADITTSLCSPKALCAKLKESCNTELKCCEGICFANHCTQCKDEGMRCGIYFAPCCDGLLCVTDPKFPKFKKCSPQLLCVDIGQKCGKSHSLGLICCQGICYHDMCVQCRIEWQECPNGQCCVGLMCTRSIWKPSVKICSKTKLCSSLFEACSSTMPCCDTICFKGRCTSCRSKGQECGLDLPQCCGELGCFTDSLDPRRRICGSSPTCIDLGSQCESFPGLPCCVGLCFDGICRQCSVAGKKCGPGNPPCCGEHKCVVEDITGKYHICQPEQLCMSKLAICNSNGQSCCPGYKCINNKCDNCLPSGETCQLGINSKPCCFGLSCDLSEDGITKICTEQVKKCIVSGGNCGYGHSAKPCCGVLTCFRGKCQSCRVMNHTCLHDYDCCGGMRCSLAINGTHSRCFPIASCKSLDQFCDATDSDGCCHGLTCWGHKCTDCLDEHYKCDDLDPQMTPCCQGLHCTWKPDGMIKTCERKPMCIMNDGLCSRNDSICCSGVCWSGRCRGCAIHNQTCEANENSCCDPLICTWDYLGIRKVCNYTKPYCIEKYGVCKEIGCCEGAYCDGYSICRPCKSGDVPCHDNGECCSGMYCTISGDGKKKYCRESPSCVGVTGICSNHPKAPSCCPGLTCWEGRCLGCTGCDECEKEVVLCDFETSNNFVRDVLLGPINEEEKGVYERDVHEIKEGIKDSKLKPSKKNEQQTSQSANVDAKVVTGLGKLAEEYDKTRKMMESQTQSNSNSSEISKKTKETKSDELTNEKDQKKKEGKIESEMNSEKKLNSTILPKTSEKPISKEKVESKENVEDPEEEENIEDDGNEESNSDSKSESKLDSNSEIATSLSSLLQKSRKTKLSPSQVSSKLTSLLGQIKSVFSKKSNSHSNSNFLRFRMKLKETPDDLDSKALKLRIESQEKKIHEGVLTESAKNSEILSRSNSLSQTENLERPKFSPHILRPCCPGLFCSYHPSGAFAQCSNKLTCIVLQGSCRLPGAKCCGTLKCIDGVCKECALQGESCEHATCCGKLICTFTSNGKLRVCATHHSCIENKGMCDTGFRRCCSPLSCWLGECRNCQKNKSPCSDSHPCCDGLHCRLDSGGIHKECSYDAHSCIHSGGKCDIPGSECCEEGFCNAQKVCQQCYSEGDRCEHNPTKCCVGLVCTFDRSGEKKICSRNVACVGVDGSCAEPISCMVDNICCHGLICNSRKKCRPPFLLINEPCRFDTHSHKTELEAPVFFSGEENLPIETCKIPLICALDISGERKICLERETCVVLEGACDHPEATCCPASFCDPITKKCLPCGTAHTSCSEDSPCCSPLLCTFDPMGFNRLCKEKEQCIMKWGHCDGPGAKCCDGFDCLKDPRSVAAAEAFEKKLEGIAGLKLNRFKEEFLPSRCLDCYPNKFHCNSDDDKKCCDGLTCGINAIGENYECMENPVCLTDLAKCGLPGAECCPGYICLRSTKKCAKCQRENEECKVEDELCCDGTLCRIDETGIKRVCSGKPICVIEEGSCKDIDSRCCQGLICNRDALCESLPKCLHEEVACMENDKPLPCCPPFTCNYDKLGKGLSCTVSQPCIEESGFCTHKGTECCGGLHCDKGKCICGHEGEICSEEQPCCGGLMCVLDSWGGKRICGVSQLCILEGGNCTIAKCCDGAICSEVAAKPVLDSNGTTYTPNITHLLCVKPENCVRKEWAECSVEKNPCCDGLLCTLDVFEKGDYCHPKAEEGTQCLTDDYCQFNQDEHTHLVCLNNICTPVNRKCGILAESCTSDKTCCHGYDCVRWGDQMRCKKVTGLRCEYEDDCVKFCDPLRGICCDEPV